jgi:guanylate kinase
MLAKTLLIIKNISMSEVILDEIRTRCAVYEPNQDVLRHLEPITMIPIIGPFAVGKSTVMQTIVEQEADFGRVQSFTTRPQRSDEADNEYRFLDDSSETLGNILSDINSGKLVQYAIHPTTSAIYGSDLQDYQKPYAIIELS